MLSGITRSEEKYFHFLRGWVLYGDPTTCYTTTFVIAERARRSGANSCSLDQDVRICTPSWRTTGHRTGRYLSLALCGPLPPESDCLSAYRFASMTMPGNGSLVS